MSLVLRSRWRIYRPASQAHETIMNLRRFAEFLAAYASIFVMEDFASSIACGMFAGSLPPA